MTGGAAGRLTDRLRRHPLVAGGLLAVAATILAAAHHADRLGKASAYLGACAAIVIATETIAAAVRPGRDAPAVRAPATESVVLLVSTALGLAAILLRSAPGWESRPGLVRIAVLGAFILFLWQIAPVLWLALRGYRPRDAGLTRSGLVHAATSGLAALAATALVAWLVAPQDVTLGPALAELGGWPALLLFCVCGEPLAEEVMRFTLQSRIGAWMRNDAAAWFLVAFVWAFLHVPMAVARGKDPAIACLGAVTIVPIGLTWGWLTWRTGSILPALVAHGFNLWGLQNL